MLHILAVRAHPTAFAKYLPVEPAARDWGFYVIDGGFTEIPPGVSYEQQAQGQHPASYLFTWEKGQTLREYQLTYITRGHGVFESRSAGRLRIAAGDVFLLFPGEWHRYRPQQTTGWDENWIGFDGDYARRLMHRFFPIAKPVLRVGYNEALLECLHAICDLLATPGVGHRPLMAAKTIEALARIYALTLGARAGDRRLIESLERSRLHLLQHSDERLDLIKLARQLGLSYSRFRSAFKIHTGASPRRYQLQIRINRAKALLLDTDRTMAEIAEQVGFASVHYFSRLFKKRIGCAPLQYRRRGASLHKP
jgi:AraC-like DNA-binding protein